MMASTPIRINMTAEIAQVNGGYHVFRAGGGMCAARSSSCMLPSGCAMYSLCLPFRLSATLEPDGNSILKRSAGTDSLIFISWISKVCVAKSLPFHECSSWHQDLGNQP